MADLTEFRQQEASQKTGIRQWWHTIDLTPEQWDNLNAALDDPTISARVIAKVVSGWQDKTVTIHQIGHYRRQRRG